MQIGKSTRYALSLVQRAIEIRNRVGPDMGKVLMFHDVSGSSLENGKGSVSISAKNLRSLINVLPNAGFSVLPLERILHEGSKYNCYITFDDGFESVYREAYPVLVRQELPFALFITVGFIGRTGYLTREMLAEISKCPLCTIGAHTLSHPILRFESSQSAINEIVNSKVTLENMLSRKIDYFAYPYGSVYACSSRDVRIVKNCGYKGAFSTINSHITSRDLRAPYFIPRMNITDYTVGRLVKNGRIG